MSSPQAAPRAAAPNAAALLAALSPARAEASRKNGAQSRGPKTPEAKARSSRNALKHGLCAQKLAVVGDEDPRALAALEAALLQELAPQGALQTVLARRIVLAAWRLERAERIEAELFAREMHGLFGDGDLGLALIRDGNGARAFDTLLRYRGSALAEFLRALRTLKALQAEAAEARAAAPAGASQAALPNQPESHADPGATAPAPGPAPQPAAGGPAPDAAAPAGAAPRPRPCGTALPPQRIEPESSTNPGQSPIPRAIVRSVAALPATSVPPDRRSST